MKAKFTEERSNAVNLYGSKEVVNEKTVAVASKGKVETPVTVRWYMGRSSSASVVYCSIWVHGGLSPKPFNTSGRGQAGGGGYHKESAAMQDALDSAGIELYGDVYGREFKPKNSPTYIGGVGDSAIDAALVAITKALGYRGKPTIV